MMVAMRWKFWVVIKDVTVLIIYKQNVELHTVSKERVNQKCQGTI